MTQKARMRDGRLLCSTCGAVVTPETTRCEQCSERLEGEYQARICPSCGAINRASSMECKMCGLSFKAIGYEEARRENDEFLERLLAWGREVEVEKPGEIGEKKEVKVLKAITPLPGPTPTQKKEIKEIEKTARERETLKKRRERLLELGEPIERALKTRWERLEELEKELDSKRRELRGLERKGKDKEKQESLKKGIERLLLERKDIKKREKELIEMDKTFGGVLSKQQRELREKEEKLKARIEAFKKELSRREIEKIRLRKREEETTRKEKNLEKRIKEISEKEKALAKREKSLERERELMSRMSGEIEDVEKKTGKKWMVNQVELARVIEKPKKNREKWLKEQRKIQQELLRLRREMMEEAGGKKEEIEEDFRARAIELENRVRELEDRYKVIDHEKRELEKQMRVFKKKDEEVKKILKILDDLLGHLPDEVIEKFAQSRDFKLYEKILRRYKL